MNNAAAVPNIFRYFWFLAAAVMLVNIVIWRFRIGAVAEGRGVTKAEVDRFVYWTAVWLVGTPLLLGLVSISAGWSSPMCAGMFMFDSVPRILSSAITIAGYTAVLWWVWRGNGARFLSRIGPALNGAAADAKQWSPALVRGVVTAAVVISSIGAAVTWRAMPAMASQGCPATITTATNKS